MLKSWNGVAYRTIRTTLRQLEERKEKRPSLIAIEIMEALEKAHCLQSPPNHWFRKLVRAIREG